MTSHRLLSLPLAIACALALPAMASATNVVFTVGPTGSDGCTVAAPACRTIQEAANLATDGDQVRVAAGTYAESVSFAAGEIRLTGTASGAGDEVGNGSAGTVLENAPSATGATPTLQFGADAPYSSVLNRITVTNTVTAGPAVASPSAGLTVWDSTIRSGAGPALSLGGSANVVQRSYLASAGGDGLLVADQTAGAHALTVDSSVLLGGGQAAALHAVSTDPGPATPAGALAIALHHITATGSQHAFSLDASGAHGTDGTPSGNITLTDSDSIALSTAGDLLVPATAPLSVPNATTVADTRTLRSSATPLFVSAIDLHLRADATNAIGQGGFTAGESAFDIQGGSRVKPSGASDLGAYLFFGDFFGGGIRSVVSASASSTRQNRPITFDAAKSAAGVGGWIVSYVWSFGDGTTTSGPTVTHAWAKRGTYAVQVTMRDNSGQSTGAFLPTPITVTDGTPPTVKVTSPRAKHTLKLTKKTTVKKKVRRVGRKTVTKKTTKTVRIPIVLSGTAHDDVGVAAVHVSIASAKVAHGKKCSWLDGKKLRVRSCSAPILLKAKLKAGRWTYRIQASAKLKPGSYKLTAVAADASGLTSAPKTVSFTLR